MQAITKVKYIGIDYVFALPGEQPQLIVNVIAEINNDGEVAEINKNFPLAGLSFSDFLGEQDRAALVEQLVNNGVITGDNVAMFSQIFKTLITKKVASDLSVEIASENYIPPVTIKEDIQELQTIVADLVAEKLGV